MAKKVRVILAWDSNSFTEEDRMKLLSLGNNLCAVKTGLQSYTALDENGVSVGYKVEKFCNGVAMRDWKLHDIGNTVTEAFKNILKMGTGFVTLHAQTSDPGLAAVSALCRGTKVEPLAVTVLTDLDDAQCNTRFTPPNQARYVGKFTEVLVENFAKNAYDHGFRGFVCSAQEAEIIRTMYGQSVTIITPAIRPLWAVTPDEQKRVTTPRQASDAGADYIVVGRPILKPPQGMTSAQAIENICEELDKAAA